MILKCMFLVGLTMSRSIVMERVGERECIHGEIIWEFVQIYRWAINLKTKLLLQVEIILGSTKARAGTSTGTW